MKTIVSSLLVTAMAITGCNQTPMPETSVNPQSTAMTLCNVQVTLQSETAQPGSTLPTDSPPSNEGGGGDCR
jgi:PBP1b-binding outer membrane lipoprotein LpoB